MSSTYHNTIFQGTEEWLQARCGMLTASEISRITTAKKIQFADNKTSRAHAYELLAQRLTGIVEPHYISDDMLRGQFDEVEARKLYSESYAPVTEVGFVTLDCGGFTLGYSPDGLVNDDGLIEIKSRRHKYQIETIITDTVPEDYMLQIQMGMLVSGRKWCDFISYSGGLPMYVKRVSADADIQEKIIAVASEFECRIKELATNFEDKSQGLLPTERKEVELVI